MKYKEILTRREMLTRCSTGFGMLALQGLMSNRAFAGEGRKLKAKAKHVILCYMSGGVSQVDSFDPKPKLRELHGKPMPVKVESCLLYTSPSPRDATLSRMPSSA